MDRHGAPAIGQPELVHEVPERTALPTGQPGREDRRGVLRGSLQERGDPGRRVVLAVCAYIDLNPVAASVAEVPEASKHTSIKQRVEHVQQQGRTDDLQAAKDGTAAGSTAAAGLEEGLWLCPIEDRQRLDSPREGMVEGFSLGNYLLLVDYTGRIYREGKAVISAELDAILERLGSSAENWQARLRKLASGRLLGRFFAATQARLREVAQCLGVRRLANLAGCMTR